MERENKKESTCSIVSVIKTELEEEVHDGAVGLLVRSS